MSAQTFHCNCGHYFTHEFEPLASPAPGVTVSRAEIVCCPKCNAEVAARGRQVRGGDNMQQIPKTYRLNLLRPKSKPGPQCSCLAEDFVPGSVPRHFVKTRDRKIKEAGFNPNFCSFHSTVVIKGKPYCSRHAGKVALAILLGEEDV